MNNPGIGKPPVDPQAEFLRDFELECTPLGPTARLMRIEADPSGGLFFQFGRRPARTLQLPADFGGRTMLLLDTVKSSALLNPETQELLALAAYLKEGQQVILFGSWWGRWIDHRGRVRTSPDMTESIQRWSLPFEVREARQWICFDFNINIHQREAFSRETSAGFREGPLRHGLRMQFELGTGRYAGSRVILLDENQRMRHTYDVKGFPLEIPTDRPAPQATHPNGAQAGAESQRETGAGSYGTAFAKARVTNTPPSPKPDRPLPKSDHLSTHDLLGLLSTEREADRRWRIMEPHLLRARPERTYPLILNHTELIAERAKAWPPARLKLAFGDQPAAILIAVMHDWSNNQILAICDGHAESERILEWMRERELDRMLKLDTASELTSAQLSREALRVDRHADNMAVKKTWRTLLGFLNADHGRMQERAIHRRKDEIAKHLQTARNLLMK